MILENLDTHTVAVELSGREEVAPPKHSIHAVATIIIRESVDLLVWHDVTRLPKRHLFRELLQDQRFDIVLRVGCTETPEVLDSGFSVLRVPLDAVLSVYDAVKLVAHSTGMSLRLNLVAVDRAAAIREGTRAIPTLHGAGRVIGFTLDNFEANMSVLRYQSDTMARTVELPVGRERDDAAAIRASYGPRPEVAIADPSIRFFRVKTSAIGGFARVRNSAAKSLDSPSSAAPC